MKYTKEDVIVWADDKRVKKDLMGELCYFGETVKEVLTNANCNRYLNVFGYVKEDFEYPFYDNSNNSHACVILKKEPKKKYVPFDLSKREDRDAVMGKRIYSKYYNADMIVYDITENALKANEWIVNGKLPAFLLCSQYVFADTGKPVGKEVE